LGFVVRDADVRVRASIVGTSFFCVPSGIGTCKRKDQGIIVKAACGASNMLGETGN